MNATKQAFYLFTTLIMLASSGWYFASSSPHFRLDADSLLTTTDTVIHQLTLHQYDTSGSLLNSLTSPLIRHIPKNNQHWLKNPVIVINQPNQSAWEIKADHAIALHGGEKITFNHHVHIHQNKDERSDESTLTTEQIIYYPKTKKAFTSKDILFEQPGNRVQSTGMKADLNTKHIQLLSQARGVYVPKQG